MDKKEAATGQTARGGSVLTIDKQGNLGMILKNQVELTTEEKKKLRGLEERRGMLSHAISKIDENIKGVELTLMKSAEYQNFVRLREKKKIAKVMLRNANVILDDAYEEVFQARGMADDKVTELYMAALPEPKEKGKAGRPKRN